MATYEIYGYVFEHLTRATPIGNPVRFYAVSTEEGFYIRKPTFEDLEYKTSTSIYPTDDLSAIEIVAFEDLPEGYIINGVTPETEVMSETDTEVTE